MLTTTTRTAAFALAALAVQGTATAETFTISVGQSIQGAINDATDGDTIVLEPGVYEQTFTIDEAAITVRSTDPSNPDIVAATVVDGLGSLGTVATITGGVTAGTHLQGLTFTRGFAPNGGAVYAINASTITISDCVLDGNVVEAASNARGGGLHAVGTVVTLERTTFSNNQALGAGADGGGAFLNGSNGHLIRDCTFVGNYASDSGSAIRKDGGGHCQLTNCVFESNDTDNTGAVFVRSGATLTADACRFVGNTAVVGSAIRIWEDTGWLTVRNSVFQGNSSSAIFNDRDVLTVDSCTFEGNNDDYAIAVISPAATTIRNSVFVNDSGVPHFVAVSDFTVSYSMLTGGFAGAGNIDAIALFADADGPDNDPTTFADNDLGPAPGSPAIDAGSTVLYCGPMSDAAGNARGIDDPDSPDLGEAVIGPIVDMGAFEYQVNPDTPVDTCPEDVNSDGSIDVNDLVAIILAWGICP